MITDRQLFRSHKSDILFFECGSLKYLFLFAICHCEHSVDCVRANVFVLSLDLLNSQSLV